MENIEAPKIVEIRPVCLHVEQKSNSVTLVKRYNYEKQSKQHETAFFKNMLAHRIDESPSIRPFSI